MLSLINAAREGRTRNQGTRCLRWDGSKNHVSRRDGLKLATVVSCNIAAANVSSENLMRNEIATNQSRPNPCLLNGRVCLCCFLPPFPKQRQ